MLLGVSGGGGVSEGNMSRSSHGSEMITLPCKRLVVIKVDVVRLGMTTGEAEGPGNPKGIQREFKGNPKGIQSRAEKV